MSFNIDKKYLDSRIRYYRRKNREVEAERLAEKDYDRRHSLLEEQFEHQAVIEELKFLKRRLQWT